MQKTSFIGLVLTIAFGTILSVLPLTLPIFALTPIYLSTPNNSKGIYGVTVEVYLKEGKIISSDKPNTLSVDENEIAIFLGDGTKEKVSSFEFRVSNENKDFYLTIKYSLNKDKIYFYNHGEKINEINLAGKDFNIGDFINDLKDKYDKGEISYFKYQNLPLGKKRIKSEYEKVIGSLKIRDGNKPKKETHNKYAVVTSDLVLNLDATNIDSMSTAASSSTTTTTWTDLSGNNNGTLTSFTLPTGATASGWDGANTISSPSALKFDGMDDYVVLTNSSSNAAYQSSQFTVAAWIKPTGFIPPSSGYVKYTIFSMGGSNTAYGYIFAIVADSTPRAYAEAVIGRGVDWDTRPIFNFNPTLVNDRWTYIAFTQANSIIYFYLNGILKGSTTFTRSYIPTPSDDIRIGQGQIPGWGGDFFKGSIANARIYNTALTADQINQNYLAGLFDPGVSSATVNGTIINQSDGGAYLVNYGQTLTLNLSSSTLTSGTVTLSTPTAPSVGTFTAGAASNPATGTYVFSPSALDVGKTITFTLRQTDNLGASSTSDLTVQVPQDARGQAALNTAQAAAATAAAKDAAANPYSPPQVIVNGMSITPQPAPTPTSIPSPTPSPQPTPVPTSTPIPEPTPEPTPSASPVASPTKGDSQDKPPTNSTGSSEPKFIDISKPPVITTQPASDSGLQNNNDLLKPIIDMVKVIRKGDSLKLVITGGKFNKLQTIVSLVPDSSLIVKNTNISQDRKTIVATYQITGDAIPSSIKLNISNQYGQTSAEINIPDKGGKSVTTVDSK